MVPQNISDYYYNKGFYLIKVSRVSAAIEMLRISIDFNPSNFKSLNLLGLCYYILGDFTKAKSTWNKSFCVNKENNQANEYINCLESEELKYMCNNYNCAVQFAKCGKFKRASKIMMQKNMQTDKFVSFLNFAGICKVAQNKKNDAMDLWKKSLSIDKDNSITLDYITGEWKVLDGSSLFGLFRRNFII